MSDRYASWHHWANETLPAILRDIWKPHRQHAQLAELLSSQGRGDWRVELHRVRITEPGCLSPATPDYSHLLRAPGAGALARPEAQWTLLHAPHVTPLDAAALRTPWIIQIWADVYLCPGSDRPAQCVSDVCLGCWPACVAPEPGRWSGGFYWAGQHAYWLEAFTVNLSQPQPALFHAPWPPAPHLKTRLACWGGYPGAVGAESWCLQLEPGPDVWPGERQTDVTTWMPEPTHVPAAPAVPEGERLPLRQAYESLRDLRLNQPRPPLLFDAAWQRALMNPTASAHQSLLKRVLLPWRWHSVNSEGVWWRQTQQTSEQPQQPHQHAPCVPWDLLRRLWQRPDRATLTFSEWLWLCSPSVQLEACKLKLSLLTELRMQLNLDDPSQLAGSAEDDDPSSAMHQRIIARWNTLVGRVRDVQTRWLSTDPGVFAARLYQAERLVQTLHDRTAALHDPLCWTGRGVARGDSVFWKHCLYQALRELNQHLYRLWATLMLPARTETDAELCMWWKRLVGQWWPVVGGAFGHALLKVSLTALKTGVQPSAQPRGVVKHGCSIRVSAEKWLSDMTGLWVQRVNGTLSGHADVRNFEPPLPGDDSHAVLHPSARLFVSPNRTPEDESCGRKVFLASYTRVSVQRPKWHVLAAAHVLSGQPAVPDSDTLRRRLQQWAVSAGLSEDAVCAQVLFRMLGLRCDFSESTLLPAAARWRVSLVLSGKPIRPDAWLSPWLLSETASSSGGHAPQPPLQALSCAFWLEDVVEALQELRALVPSFLFGVGFVLSTVSRSTQQLHLDLRGHRLLRPVGLSWRRTPRSRPTADWWRVAKQHFPHLTPTACDYCDPAEIASVCERPTLCLSEPSLPGVDPNASLVLYSPSELKAGAWLHAHQPTRAMLAPKFPEQAPPAPLFVGGGANALLGAVHGVSQHTSLVSAQVPLVRVEVPDDLWFDEWGASEAAVGQSQQVHLSAALMNCGFGNEEDACVMHAGTLQRGALDYTLRPVVELAVPWVVHRPTRLSWEARARSRASAHWSALPCLYQGHCVRACTSGPHDDLVSPGAPYNGGSFEQFALAYGRLAVELQLEERLGGTQWPLFDGNVAPMDEDPPDRQQSSRARPDQDKKTEEEEQKDDDWELTPVLRARSDGLEVPRTYSTGGRTHAKYDADSDDCQTPTPVDGPWVPHLPAPDDPHCLWLPSLRVRPTGYKWRSHDSAALARWCGPAADGRGVREGDEEDLIVLRKGPTKPHRCWLVVRGYAVRRLAPTLSTAVSVSLPGTPVADWQLHDTDDTVQLVCYLEMTVRPRLGQKVETGGGNKMVLSALVPTEDMPFADDGRHGTGGGVPMDLLINPASCFARGIPLETQMFTSKAAITQTPFPGPVDGGSWDLPAPRLTSQCAPVTYGWHSGTTGDSYHEWTPASPEELARRALQPADRVESVDVAPPVPSAAQSRWVPPPMGIRDGLVKVHVLTQHNASHRYAVSEANTQDRHPLTLQPLQSSGAQALDIMAVSCLVEHGQSELLHLLRQRSDHTELSACAQCGHKLYPGLRTPNSWYCANCHDHVDKSTPVPRTSASVLELRKCLEIMQLDLSVTSNG